MSIENEDIYALLCNVHKDLGVIKGATDTFQKALDAHIEDDKLIIRAVYDTQISPVAKQVDDLRLAQAQQRGRTRAWGTVATIAGVLSGAASAAAALLKWH